MDKDFLGRVGLSRYSKEEFEPKNIVLHGGGRKQFFECTWFRGMEYWVLIFGPVVIIIRKIIDLSIVPKF